jgi:hypothetical protein
VKRSVCPETAPEIVEYSPAYEQVEIVTNEPAVLIVADPKDEVFAQPTTGVHPDTVVTEVVLHVV